MLKALLSEFSDSTREEKQQQQQQQQRGAGEGDWRSSQINIG